MKNEMTKLKVKFTQQQLELLNKLKKEGLFGKNYEEIIANVFRAYIKQTFGERGA